MTTYQLQASHIIAYQAGQHRHLRDGVVVWEGNSIVHVGSSYEGPVDTAIDAQDCIVTPGFVNTHAHLSGSPLDKSFIEDRGSRQFYLSGLFEYLPVRNAAQDTEASHAALHFSMAEMLRSGTTTVLEIGSHGQAAIDAAGEAGLRLYMGLGYRSGSWHADDGRRVTYTWNEEAGFKGLDSALSLVRALNESPEDRIRGCLSPMQIDTCTAELLLASKSAANELGVPLTLHASQSVSEFQEMTRRHGRTPIEWLADIGFLGPEVILGHAIITAGSSWTNYYGDDLSILAQTGTKVAHCPWVFARRGIAMESYARYLDAGITMTLGTDTCPQSMIEAMRWAAVVSKLVERRTDVATAADVFNSATLSGAEALGREDLGRIAPGAKADMVIWNAESLCMTPLRDPIKNIVYNAQGADVRSVVIDGDFCLRDGVILGFDERAAVRDLQEAAERMWPAMERVDRDGRSVDQLSPQSFPPFQE
ncbi:MAG: chlorohydrolase family protein [Thermomicrobiales bacterium]